MYYDENQMPDQSQLAQNVYSLAKSGWKFGVPAEKNIDPSG
jgi:hypothetical protein